MPEAAICVQDIDVQCVLQFTLIHAAGCALHRHTSRVIHRLELSTDIRSFRGKKPVDQPTPGKRRPIDGRRHEAAKGIGLYTVQKTKTVADLRVGDRRESGRFIKPG